MWMCVLVSAFDLELYWAPLIWIVFSVGMFCWYVLSVEGSLRTVNTWLQEWYQMKQC